MFPSYSNVLNTSHSTAGVELFEAVPRPVLIFGRSPFVGELDLNRFFLHRSENATREGKHYETVGFNSFGLSFKPDWLFFFDRWYEHQGSNVVMPKWFHQKGFKYAPKPTDKPFLRKEFDHDGSIKVAHRYFTVSAALNWLMIHGRKQFFLIGIDHVESDKTFDHFDVQQGEAPSRLTVAAHQRLKQMVYNCAKHVEIYQCNPAVKDDWRLPYMDVKDL